MFKAVRKEPEGSRQYGLRRRRYPSQAGTYGPTGEADAPEMTEQERLSHQARERGRERVFAGSAVKYKAKTAEESEKARREHEALERQRGRQHELRMHYLKYGEKGKFVPEEQISGIGGGTSAADRLLARRRRIQDVMEESKRRRAEYDKATGKRMQQTGAVPRAIIQAPGAAPREFQGSETQVGTYARGAYMPERAYSEMAGLQGDVARGFGTGGQALPGGMTPAQYVQQQAQLATQAGVPQPPTGQYLTPEQHAYVASKMYPYGVQPGGVEGPRGTEMTPADFQFIQAIDQQPAVRDWAVRYSASRGNAELQAQLVGQLASVIPDPQQRSAYMRMKGLGGAEVQPGFTGAPTGPRPMPVAGYGEGIQAGTQGWQAQFPNLEQQIASAQDRLMQLAQTPGAQPGGLPITGGGPEADVARARAKLLTEQAGLTEEQKKMLRERGMPPTEAEAAHMGAQAGTMRWPNFSAFSMDASPTFLRDSQEKLTSVSGTLRQIRHPDARLSYSAALLNDPGFRAALDWARDVQSPNFLDRVGAMLGTPGTLTAIRGQQGVREVQQAAANYLRLYQMLMATQRGSQATTQPAGGMTMLPPRPGQITQELNWGNRR